MYYKTYGNTGLKVSAIGMGTMRYNSEDIKAGRLEKCAEVALYAFEKGINYFDSAPFYCSDKSEIITGMALSQLPRDRFYVTSKTNFNTIGKSPTEADFFERLETSLTRLKVDYLDFYHLWCMLSPESYRRHCDTLYPWFEKAHKRGLVRNIVFSSHMQGNDLQAVIEEQKFRGMLIGYNALNYRFRQAGLESAYENGMGVVVMNPLGGGLIPAKPELFSYLTEGTDLNVAQAALAFVASHREVSVTLCGFTTKEQVDEAVKAVENLQELPARELLQKYENKGVALNDLCTGCGYCDHCPQGIAIPKYMDAYNQKLLGTGDRDILERLDMHWDIMPDTARDCIGCGECEARCTQHLPIIERLKHIGTLSFDMMQK